MSKRQTRPIKNEKKKEKTTKTCYDDAFYNAWITAEFQRISCKNLSLLCCFDYRIYYIG